MLVRGPDPAKLSPASTALAGPCETRGCFRRAVAITIRAVDRESQLIAVRVRFAISNSIIEKIVTHVNRKAWWHVPPHDPTAYSKRGKFFASSFREAEFYGRPLDDPQRVAISKPLVGDEKTIAKVLGIPPQHDGMSLEEIAAHDVLWRNAALSKGFDSIVLMAPKSFISLKNEGKLPRSLELNVLL